MNKRLRLLLLTALLMMCMICTAFPAWAADSDGSDYEYTIRIFSGDKGTFSDGSSVIILKNKYGDEVNLSPYTVNVSESKYHQSGYKISGRDDLANPVFTVTKDQDYVVAYAINGLSVKYTVNFVEYGTGTVLRDPVVYSGNEGEKPVTAYLYIDGYRPRYRNITKTLVNNEAENVFTFEYIKRPVNMENATPVPGDPTLQSSQSGGRGAAAGQNAGSNAAGTNSASADKGVNTVNPEDADTMELLDLDEMTGTVGLNSAAPSAESADQSQPGGPSGSGLVTLIACIAGGVLIIVLIILLILARKKKKNGQ